MAATNYSVTIRVLGPHAGGPCRVLPAPQPCSRPTYYAVTATTEESGTTSDANVCPDHLFATIAYFLGLPGNTAAPS